MRSRVSDSGGDGIVREIGVLCENVFDPVTVIDATENGIHSHPRAANYRRAALDDSIDDNASIALRSNHGE